jgi:quinol monooxygenase YgiN
MTNSAIHVGVARFFIKDGEQDHFMNNLDGSVGVARANPENYQFEYYRYNADTRRILLYQTFLDDAAWERHRTSPLIHASHASSVSAMEVPPERSVWRPVSLDGGVPSRPTGGVESAAMIIVKAIGGARERIVDAVRARFDEASAPAGFLRADLSLADDDPERLVLFTRWSKDGAYRAEMLSDVIVGASETLMLRTR